MHVSRGGGGSNRTHPRRGQRCPDARRAEPEEAWPGEAGRAERTELGMGVPPGMGPGRKFLSWVDGMGLRESSFPGPSALSSLKEMCFCHFSLPALDSSGQK